MDAISSVGIVSLSGSQHIHYARHSLENGKMLQQVASQLGIDPPKLQEAVKAAKSEGKQGKDLLAAVADKLGIKADALQQAIQQARQADQGSAARLRTRASAPSASNTVGTNIDVAA